jgi:hypothetical protein
LPGSSYCEKSCWYTLPPSSTTSSFLPTAGRRNRRLPHGIRGLESLPAGTTFAGTSTSAIFVSGTTAAVSKCRFVQNRADADGDGIIKIQDGSNVTLTQSTWQSNTGYFYHTGGPTARLFSDVKDNSLVACQNCQGQALPLSSPIAPRGVISGSDPALAELIAVCFFSVINIVCSIHACL